MRELLTFSMLVALGGADAQVRGHVSGNLRVGNTRARLLAVLTVLVPFIGYPPPSTGWPSIVDDPAGIDPAFEDIGQRLLDVRAHRGRAAGEGDVLPNRDPNPTGASSYCGDADPGDYTAGRTTP